MLLAGKNTLTEINTEIKKLSAEDQKLLLIKLKKGELLEKAKLINSRVKKNKVPVAKIVATVNRNRRRNAD